MSEEPQHLALATILANVGSEVCSTLVELRDSLGRIMARPEATLPQKQKSYALTMIGLCDELDRLTRDTLGCGGGPPPPA